MEKKNKDVLLKSMKPKHNLGEFVFCKIENFDQINLNEIIMTFKKEESISFITKKEVANKLNLTNSFIAYWIKLIVNSSLEAVGLTAAFPKFLPENEISCNFVAAYYHGHI